MESSGDIGILEYVRLMEAYMAGRIHSEEYAKSFFAFNKRRANLPDDVEREIILRSHGDAEDYEPDPLLRQANSHWIGEVELKERVAQSLRELTALGYGANRE